MPAFTIRDSTFVERDASRMLTMTPDATVAELTREVAELRREVQALRDALAVEVRTRRIVVADGDRDVTIEPGDITVHHRANGCYVSLHAEEEYATVDVTAWDVSPATVGYDVDRIQHINLVAWAERDVEPGGPYCEVVVDGVELPRLTVAGR